MLAKSNILYIGRFYFILMTSKHSEHGRYGKGVGLPGPQLISERSKYTWTNDSRFKRLTRVLTCTSVLQCENVTLLCKIRKRLAGLVI